jgi:uncharacterized spore protein YtfJ
MKTKLIFQILLNFILSISAIAQCDFGTGLVGSNNAPFAAGSGAVNIVGNNVTVTSNVNIVAGVYNFDNFTVNNGVVITVTAGVGPLIIKCTGTATINGAIRSDGGDGGNGTQGVFSGGIGGAGGIGGSGSSTNAGNGGIGFESLISGTSKFYGGGGGGGANSWHGGYDSGGIHGSGGNGGGGNGASHNSPSTAGTPNTGGGGGGGFGHSVRSDNIFRGSAGGSGIVIIKIHNNDKELKKKLDKDTKIINEIKDEFRKKLKNFVSDELPYNKFSMFPLVILILIFWIFIFLFLLKFVHHYFANIYLYILISILIFLLLFGSLWFLYSNNDLL